MRHVTRRLTGHGRHDIPAQAGPGSHPHTAVVRLAEGVELQEQILADRPALVATALLGGATAVEITAVLGWELDELRLAIGRWAPQLARAGQLTEGQCTALQAVVVEPTSVHDAYEENKASDDDDDTCPHTGGSGNAVHGLSRAGQATGRQRPAGYHR
jgi:hypothetical protein